MGIHRENLKCLECTVTNFSLSSFFFRHELFGAVECFISEHRIFQKDVGTGLREKRPL